MRLLLLLLSAALIVLTGCTSELDLTDNPGYTVSFDARGGSGVASQTVVYGNLLPEPVSPVKEEFVFSGWFEESGCTTAWVFSSNTVLSNTTLYAKWVTNYAYMVSVPGGTYTQEDISGNGFEHTINGFHMGKFEVTYGLWYKVKEWADTNGYTFANAGREGNDGTNGAAPTVASNEPVTMVNWRDCIVWCNAYSEMSGFSPVYCSDSGHTTAIRDSSDGSYGSGISSAAGSFDNPYINMNADGYRLPTEGEWQYAASYIDGTSWLSPDHVSGDTSSYCYPNDSGVSTVYEEYCWHYGNSGSTTRDAGTRLPNQLGIHDMSGNVWEWCQDWQGVWPTGAENGYLGPTNGSSRMTRGCSFNFTSESLQIGVRPATPAPYLESANDGFRLVRTP